MKIDKSKSKVNDHFYNPRNPGELDKPSGEGFSGNPAGRLYKSVKG